MENDFSDLLLREDESNLIVPLIVRPHGRKEAIVGTHDGALRVEITEAPERGEANEAIIRFFAKILSKPRSEVTIIKGHTSRRKVLLLYNISRSDMLMYIKNFLPES